MLFKNYLRNTGITLEQLLGLLKKAKKTLPLIEFSQLYISSLTNNIDILKGPFFNLFKRIVHERSVPPDTSLKFGW